MASELDNHWSVTNAVVISNSEKGHIAGIDVNSKVVKKGFQLLFIVLLTFSLLMMGQIEYNDVVSLMLPLLLLIG